MAYAIVPLENFEWFSSIEGDRPDTVDEATYKSIIRYARNYSECDIIPIIREYVMLAEPNETGDIVLMTVQYNSRGWVSSAGGQLDNNGRIKWMCYAD